MLYFRQKIWTFCHKASLPFPGKVDIWDCGITFDIFTHVFTWVFFLFKFIKFFFTNLDLKIKNAVTTKTPLHILLKFKYCICDASFKMPIQWVGHCHWKSWSLIVYPQLQSWLESEPKVVRLWVHQCVWPWMSLGLGWLNRRLFLLSIWCLCIDSGGILTCILPL